MFDRMWKVEVPQNNRLTGQAFKLIGLFETLVANDGIGCSKSHVLLKQITTSSLIHVDLSYNVKVISSNSPKHYSKDVFAGLEKVLL